MRWVGGRHLSRDFKPDAFYIRYACSHTILLVKSPTKTIKDGRDQHFQESTSGGFSEVSVTRVSERGRGV